MDRRRFVSASLALAPLPLLSGCAAPLPALAGASATPAARALLDDCAAAHGLAAFEAIDDISVGYAGEWRPLIGRIQPVLVDAGFRQRSEERLLPRRGIVAQAHRGPAGEKQVVRRAGFAAGKGGAGGQGGQGQVQVWSNGATAGDADVRAAAALVADGYRLFLLGPLALVGAASTGSMAMATGTTEPVDGRDCDVLRLRLAPGLGFTPSDEIALFIDRDQRLMRRVRFTLDGLASTRGAVAEVDADDHVTLGGVRWPTRFHERLLRPFPLPVHDWRVTGLDLNRGWGVGDVDGPAFRGAALVPAAALPPPPFGG